MTYKSLRNFSVSVNVVLKHFTRSDGINQSCGSMYLTLLAHIRIFALDIWHVIASFIHRIISSFVACMAAPYFSTLYHKRHDFRKKLLNVK